MDIQLILWVLATLSDEVWLHYFYVDSWTYRLSVSLVILAEALAFRPAHLLQYFEAFIFGCNKPAKGYEYKLCAKRVLSSYTVINSVNKIYELIFNVEKERYNEVK